MRPGKKTSEYIDRVLTRITLPGAMFLALNFALAGLSDPRVQRALLLRRDEPLIVVGVALDTVRQMESHLLMRHYEGFLRRRTKVRA